MVHDSRLNLMVFLVSLGGASRVSALGPGNLHNKDSSAGSPIFSTVQRFSVSSVLFSIFTFIIAQSILSVFSAFF